MLTGVKENRGEKRHVTSTNWTTITRQLRKYAFNSRVRNIIVADQSVAIYFRFIRADDPTEVVQFLVANSGISSDESVSFHELVAFNCWRGLKDKDVTMRGDSEGIAVPPQYTSTSEYDASPDEDRTTRDFSSAPAKRTKYEPQGPVSGSGLPATSFDWSGSGSWELTLDEVLGGNPKRSKSPKQPHDDSGCEDSGSTRIRQPPPALATTYYVLKRITSSVAVITTDNTDNTDNTDKTDKTPKAWIAKFHPPDPDSQLSLANERNAYEGCHRLQGCQVPHAYGTYCVTSIEGRVLILEYVLPGNTITSLKQEHTAQLKDRAIAALTEIHRCSITLNDIHGDNMVVSKAGDEEMVVFIDFGYATKTPERIWEDWSLFRAVFPDNLISL